MLADLTFTVELTDEEGKFLVRVLGGESNAEIARNLRVPVERVRQVFEELRLHINLIDATRAKQITWRLRIASI